MPGAAVGLYCAVGHRFDLLVSTYTIAVRETQAVFSERAESLSTGLGALNLGLGQSWQREPEYGAAQARNGRPPPAIRLGPR